MTATEPTISIATASTSSCVHHWLLGDSVEGRIPATCKLCGSSKGFSSNPEGTERFDDYRELTQSSTYYGGRQAA